jgi:hypothetical protein
LLWRQTMAWVASKVCWPSLGQGGGSSLCRACGDREDCCADCSPRLPVDAGTLISGYSKAGTWGNKWQGDKTVAFAFDSPDTPVVFEKELMPLIEAMSIADGVRLSSWSGWLRVHLFQRFFSCILRFPTPMKFHVCGWGGGWARREHFV